MCPEKGSKSLISFTDFLSMKPRDLGRRLVKRRVVQYSDKFMHGIVLYCVHITILNKSITIENEAKQ